MVLAAFLFMRRMTQISNVNIITQEINDHAEKDDPQAIQKYTVAKGIEVFEINGPFFFGAAYKFKESMRVLKDKAQVLIIRMRAVPVIDATGLHALEEVYKAAKKQGTRLVISGIQHEVYKEFEKSGLLGLIGKENVLTNIDNALARANELLLSE